MPSGTGDAIDTPPGAAQEDVVIRKVLVANRGEIARRVMQTLHDMELQAVAVVAEVESAAPHRLEADQTVVLEASDPTAAYLDAAQIVDAARRHGCDAVHPGYGFLSENADFARRCVDAGLVWIGPPPAAITAMGDKVRARTLMEGAGVPVVPGTAGTRGDVTGLARAAEAIGFPVLIKAAAGGGGKGMRIVDRAADFMAAAERARSEAENAFGDGTLYVEKYLRRPRHVELQVFADDHGHTVHLFERECSIQRRHQKIVEEAPATCVDEALRARMGAAAVAAACAVDYRGAGTVEFLLDEDGAFYFLEMNTRLQVEHPVTEAITGLDLVRLQIEVANGMPLAAAARRPTLRGHALECRVYAEDPAAGFLPGSGPLLRLRLPEGPGVRVDAALREGQEISIHYDPLLAKVITWGRDRDEARARMQRALREFVILGVPTNLVYLQDILRHPAFVSGELTTDFLREHFEAWQPQAAPLSPEAAAALLIQEGAGAGAPGGRAASGTPRTAAPSPWSTLRGWIPSEGEG